MIAGRHSVMGGDSIRFVEWLERSDPFSDPSGNDWANMYCIFGPVYLTDNYEIECGMTALEVTGGAIMGCAPASTGGSGVRIFNYNSTVYFDQGPTDANGRLTGSSGSFPVNEYHYWKFGNRYAYRDGVQLLSSTAMTGVSHGRIVCMCSKCRLMYYRVSLSGVVVFDGVPAVKGSEGVLYDKVSGQCFGYTGPTPLTYGPEVKSPKMPYPYFGEEGLLLCLNARYNQGVGVYHPDTSSLWVDLARNVTLSQVGSSTQFSFSGNKCSFTTTKRALEYTGLDFSGITAFSCAGLCDSVSTWGVFVEMRSSKSTSSGTPRVEFFPCADNIGTYIGLWNRFVPYTADAQGLHVAFTFDGSTAASFYVNGVLAETGTVASDTLSWLQQITYVTVGGEGQATGSNAGQYPPSGSSLYDFSCWDACLTAAQVSKLCADTKSFYGIS